MAVQKSRSKAKQQPKPKPLFHLDKARWEEIAAIGVLILAALTALGALDLSGGILLSSWVEFLQMLLGWGVYFAPILLLGFGVWLLLDALDRHVDIGWERPIGLALGYLGTLAVLHWISSFSAPTHMPGPFQGGGLMGWAIADVFIQLLGAFGAAFALLAILSAALILLFNISLPELFRRLFYVAYLIRHLPEEIRRLGKKPSLAPDLTSTPSVTVNRRRPYLPQPSTPALPTPKPKGEKVAAPPIDQEQEPPVPMAARIIGSSDTSTTATGPLPAGPAIQREWRLPNLSDVLEDISEAADDSGEVADNQVMDKQKQEAILQRAHLIEQTLAHFGVPANVTEANIGPAITQFGVEPGFIEQKAGDGRVHRVKVKVSRISALQHDLELALAAAPIRIEAPVPGRSVVGIEVPNKKVAVVNLRGIIESDEFTKIKSKLRIALGQDVAGQPMCADLVKMPHLLIAGATGSGKSVCINSIVATMLAMTTPAEVRFIMVDPKRVELVNFNGIPHLLGPVVTGVDDAIAVLKSAVEEMDRRLQVLARKSARNLDAYNHMADVKPEEKLPYIVVIVDELADLMMTKSHEVEPSITRLAQMARATGIHLILATQRPSVDVVTGLIKANFPSRISFAVTSQIDSRVVLDTPGAEKLLGHGDMLYMASDSSKLLRLQGCFVSDDEMDKLVKYWKGFAPPLPTATSGELPTQFKQAPLFDDASTGKPPTLAGPAPEDDLLPQAMEVVKQNRKASVSFLQRKLRIGYSRAARLMELLEQKGIVGPDAGPTKGRIVVESPAAPTQSSHSSTSISSGSSRRKTEKEEEDYSNWTEEDWNDLDKE